MKTQKLIEDQNPWPCFGGSKQEPHFIRINAQFSSLVTSAMQNKNLLKTQFPINVEQLKKPKEIKKLLSIEEIQLKSRSLSTSLPQNSKKLKCSISTKPNKVIFLRYIVF